MQAWDGVLGIIGRLPVLQVIFGKLISLWKMRRSKYLAWPNISAGKMIVPEKVGAIYPKDIAKETLQWLQSPERLKGQREDLRSLRGNAGAVERLSTEIIKLLPQLYITKNTNQNRKDT